MSLLRNSFGEMNLYSLYLKCLLNKVGLLSATGLTVRGSCSVAGAKDVTRGEVNVLLVASMWPL